MYLSHVFLYHIWCSILNGNTSKKKRTNRILTVAYTITFESKDKSTVECLGIFMSKGYIKKPNLSGVLPSLIKIRDDQSFLIYRFVICRIMLMLLTVVNVDIFSIVFLVQLTFIILWDEINRPNFKSSNMTNAFVTSS